MFASINLCDIHKGKVDKPEMRLMSDAQKPILVGGGLNR